MQTENGEHAELFWGVQKCFCACKEQGARIVAVSPARNSPTHHSPCYTEVHLHTPSRALSQVMGEQVPIESGNVRAEPTPPPES